MLVDALAAHADARDWGAACAAAEDLARQRGRLALGAWRLPLGTAVVLCAEAARTEGDFAGEAPSAAADAAPQPGARTDAAAAAAGWRCRLSVASMRLLAGWFGLLVRYQRQHVGARMTAATSALIARGVAAALSLAQHGLHAPAAAPAEAPAGGSASAPEGLHAAGGPGQDARADQSSARGADVAAAALAALGAALELMDAKTRGAAQAAALAALERPTPSPCRGDAAGGGASECALAPRHATACAPVLSELGLRDALDGWVEFVTHVPPPVARTKPRPASSTQKARGGGAGKGVDTGREGGGSGVEAVGGGSGGSGRGEGGSGGGGGDAWVLVTRFVSSLIALYRAGEEEEGGVEQKNAFVKVDGAASAQARYEKTFYVRTYSI